jgi:hypothetical protein
MPQLLLTLARSGNLIRPLSRNLIEHRTKWKLLLRDRDNSTKYLSGQETQPSLAKFDIRSTGGIRIQQFQTAKDQPLYGLPVH